MDKRTMELRIRRLAELSRGLSLEASYLGVCDSALHYQERRGYINALSDALAGIESARVVLVQASQRMEGEGGL